MKCTGGCLKILKVLYSCEEKDNSIAEQVEKVKARCENKESCMVSASRRMFGGTECPGSPDEDMLMWITYRCDGGQDRTKLTGRKRCPITPKVQGNCPGGGGGRCVGGCGPNCRCECGSCNCPTSPTTKTSTTKTTRTTRRTTTRSTCSTRRGRKLSRDIPLDGGWINIMCNPRGRGGGDRRHRVKRSPLCLFGVIGFCGRPQRPRPRDMGTPCIKIHKILAGCTSNDPMVAAQQELVSPPTYSFF